MKQKDEASKQAELNCKVALQTYKKVCLKAKTGLYEEKNYINQRTPQRKECRVSKNKCYL